MGAAVILVQPVRTELAWIFQGVAPATADTLLSMTTVFGGFNQGAQTSFAQIATTITRIKTLEFSIQSGAAAAAFATLNFRINPSGAVTLGSQSMGRFDLGNTEAAIGAARSMVVDFGSDGLEFQGAQQFGFSLAAQAITNVISICARGYIYRPPKPYGFEFPAALR